MYKMWKKIIATILVSIILFANISMLGSYGKEVYANEHPLETQTSQTNHENVTFDVYFKEQNTTTHTAVKNIGEENQLYVKVEVKEAGYLKYANISWEENSNFKVGEMVSDYVAKVENTKMTLNQIQKGTTAEIEIPIQMAKQDIITEEVFQKENVITLTGTYIDGNGKEKAIEKQITIGLGWDAKVEASLHMQVNKFIPYHIGEKKGLMLQTVVQATIKDNILPVKQETIEISVPSIKGIKPSEVKVVANTTKQANGEENAISFTQENYNYQAEENKITIQLQNKEEITWLSDAQDEFVVTYIYEEEATNAIVVGEEGCKIEMQAKADITLYSNTIKEVSAEFKGEATLREQISNLVDFRITSETKELSKGYLYNNKKVQEKIETEYQETMTANIGLAEITDNIRIVKEADHFVIDENTKGSTTVNGTSYAYYKTLTVDKEMFQKILGEEGKITIYQGETELVNITKETPVSEQGKIEISLVEFNINSFRMEISKPITEGKLSFAFTKAIKGEVGYSASQIKTFTSLELAYIGQAFYQDSAFVEQNARVSIPFVEPTSQAELVMEQNSLSTVVTNQDVTFTAILKTDHVNCKLYQNPTISITLPSYIETIAIKNIEVLFDTEATKLTVKTHRVVANADGSKSIIVELEGTQTQYTIGAISKGTNVVITSDITVNKLTPNKEAQITMQYTNQNMVTQNTALRASALGSTQEVEQNQVSTKVNFVAPTGVITTSSISGYAENGETVTSISGEQKTATIETMTTAKNTTFNMSVINNYNNTIDHVVVLGRFPFAGNKELVTGADLGTTMNMKVTSGISVTGVDSSKVTIYYSTNGEATKDINLAANSWTTTPASLDTVKSYCIVIKNHEMNTEDSINFSYGAEIPANLQHNQNAFEQYVVYFNNNLATGLVEDKNVATKLGVSTGTGPVLEASLVSDKAKTEEVLEGNIIKYTLTVKNTGTEDARNVVASILLPKGMILQLGPNEEYTIEEDQQNIQIKYVKINLGNIKPDQTITKEIDMKVFGLMVEEDTLTIETNATVIADNISGEMKTSTVQNTIAKAHYVVKRLVSTKINTLKENDTYTYKMEIASADSTQKKQNTVLEIVLPQELDYENLQITKQDTDITSEINHTYNTKTRILSISLGEVDSQNLKKKVILTVKVGKLAEDEYDKTVNIQASVSGTGVRKQNIDTEELSIARVGMKVTQTSNIPENAKISAYEDFKYIYTIENLSSIAIQDFKFTNLLPKGIDFARMSITYQGGTSFNSYEKDSEGNPTIELEVKKEKPITIEVYVTAQNLDANTKISNVAKIEHPDLGTITTNSITHTIEKYEASEDSNNAGGTTGGNTQEATKRIMGVVWNDANKDGIKDEKEDKISDVEIMLFNNKTGKLVANSSSEGVLKIKTDAEGSYTFKNIAKGSYSVIFLYDTANYSATVYQKENVEETKNSDAVDSKITLDGVTRIAGITEEIQITDANIYNIDLGLITNPKFDLKLEKAIAKITVTDNTGTQTYDYKNTKLAKRDLVAKQINNTTVIVEYKITVSNEGAVPGYVKKIADYMPSEMKFNSELNRDWYTAENGALYNSSLANTIINPGESKEVTLLLTKKMSDQSLGLINNTAEIYEAYNDLGIEDVDSTEGNKVSSEDDISSADVLFTVKTGETILFISLSISIIAAIGVGAYFIKKKVLR